MCNVYKHQPPCQIRGAVVSKLQFGSGRAHDTIQKSFLQDEAKKIAKDEIETDVYDLAERSGRADKVYSRVTFYFKMLVQFIFRLNLLIHVTISEPSYLIDSLALRDIQSCINFRRSVTLRSGSTTSSAATSPGSPSSS